MDNNQPEENSFVKSPWVQGYTDALNDTINIHAYETDEDYKDGYETAAEAEIEYVKLYINGDGNGF